MNHFRYFKLLSLWSIVALIYCLEFFIRVSPNTLQEYLHQDLAINYSQLGEVSAFFYYSYALFQIPSGWLLNRFGINSFFSIFPLIFSISLYFFSYSSSLLDACISRFFMGLGASITFTALLHMAHEWFDQKNFSKFVSVANLFGMIGALASSYPLEILLLNNSWQNITRNLSYLLIALTIFVFILLKIINPINPRDFEEDIEIPDYFDKKLFIKLLFIAVAIASPIMILPEMWGSLFLEEIYGLSEMLSGKIISLFFIGIICGNFLNIFFRKEFAPLRILKLTIIIELICVSFFISGFNMSPFFLAFSALLIGSCASSMLLTFTMVQSLFPNKSFSLALFNIGVMLFPAFIQPLIGLAIDIGPLLGLKISSTLKISMYLLPALLLPAYTVANSIVEKDN